MKFKAEEEMCRMDDLFMTGKRDFDWLITLRIQ